MKVPEIETKLCNIPLQKKKTQKKINQNERKHSKFQDIMMWYR